MSKRKKEKKEKFIVLIIIIFAIITGTAMIVYSFKQANKAAKIQDKILYYYLNSKDK